MGKRAVLVVSVFALLSALPACGSSKQTASTTSTTVREIGTVTVRGASLPTFTAGTEDPALGMDAPVVSGRDFTGDPVTIDATSGDEGHANVVLIVAHWGSHSGAQVERVGRWLSDDALPSNVRMYAISTEVRPSSVDYPPSRWLAAQGIGTGGSPVPVLADSRGNEARNAYGAHSYPFWLFIDEHNVVARRWSGELSDTSLTRMVNALAAGEPVVGPSTTTTTTEPETTTTTEDVPETTTTTEAKGGSIELSADSLMSMIGRPVTEEEIGALAKMCYRSFLYGQDVHCEQAAGFGLSFDNGSVREVYLYDYYPPDQSSFPGALPGGVKWDSTLSDILGSLGEPDCVDSIIGYNLEYTMNGLDVEYTVDSNAEPTAGLYKITIRPSADRPASCHPR